MAWIRVLTDEQADGPLRAIFAAARARAGRVYNILRIQGLNPPVLQATIDLYRAIMFGPSPLSRALRELLAVRVSAANRCEY